MPRIRPAAALLLSASLAACAADDPTGPPRLQPTFNAGVNGPNLCQPFQAEGISYAIGPTTFSGTAAAWIGGVQHPVSVVTELTGFVKQGANPAHSRGAQVVTTSHHFDFGSGNTLTTEDIARLVPTNTPGLFKLISTLRISEATGTFASVVDNPNPRFTSHQTSTMDLRGLPTVDWSFDAHICGYGG